MESFLVSLVIALLGAIAGAFGMMQFHKDSHPVNPQNKVSRPSKAEKAEEKANKKKEELHEQIQNESNTNIVKRFFGAFGHKPGSKSGE